ncbi:polyprenyl synthetase family protein [Spirochaeta africana]|uniref:Geranylgeranyl pyrophosphate synthase n=1 Tax=Spirochaeta africana (strain ATCC 700263 / DSM 8902 / Z-7692) TaxID=889378 RepID=H9UF97_SPIAZ|nr:polyprenyl synthetase family protein [Spirochaeta africana]AFG36190.1 geranylgeranyl pyrophosphate synthase [Spirochaeta africana DSM 8902]
MHNFWSEEPSLADDLRRTHAAMRELVVGDSTRLAAAVQSLLENQGKMLRPALVLMAARFGSPEADPVRGLRGHLRGMSRRRFPVRRSRGESCSDAGQELPGRFYRLAAAIELLHVATLVHDDIIDEAETRRGKPALHMELGSRQAVLIGDLLFASSFETLIRDGGFATMQGAAGAVRNLSRGAISEVEDHRIPTRREYLQRIYGKTAVLFMTALQIGASEAHVPPRVAAGLVRVGYNLGMGFQIIDDILDLTGDPARLGKPRDTDLLEGVYTLPLVYAARSQTPEAQDLLQLVRQAGPEPHFSTGERDRIRTIAIETGGVREAQRDAMRYTERAVREIGRLPEVPERDCLRRMVERLLERDY